VLSENTDLDGRELPLEGALQLVVGYQMASFLSCLAGRLVYYEGEGINERYFLQREEKVSDTMTRPEKGTG
jgi:hypothetical protein